MSKKVKQAAPISLGSIAKEYALLTLGTVIMAVGTYFFKFPNNFSTGGVSGLAVLLAPYLSAVSQGSLGMR